MEKLKKEVENQLERLTENGINRENIDNVYKLIDIHKDIANEEYWECKKEVMKNENVRKLWKL